MTRIAYSAALAAAGLALAACDRAATDGTVGQKLDHAVQRTEQSLEQAGEKTRETLRENAPTVEQKLSTAGHKIEAATEKTVDKTRDVVNDASHKANETAHTSDKTTSSSSSSDLMITASIKADLVKDPDLSALKIDVDTHDGVVTLNGLASDEAAKQRAEHMAQAVKGVREVRNYLTLKRG